MTEVDKNKARLQVVEEEYKRLPALAGQILQIMRLKGSELKDTDTARWRYAFRMLMAKYILEAFIKKGTFGDIEAASEALGDTVLDELRETVARLVDELLELAAKSEKKSDG